MRPHGSSVCDLYHPRTCLGLPEHGNNSAGCDLYHPLACLGLAVR